MWNFEGMNEERKNKGTAKSRAAEDSMISLIKGSNANLKDVAGKHVVLYQVLKNPLKIEIWVCKI